MGYLETLTGKNFDDIPKAELVEPGEYTLKIVAARCQPKSERNETAPDDAMNIFVAFRVVDHPAAPPIFNYHPLPNSESDLTEEEDRMRQIRDELCAAFDLDPDPEGQSDPDKERVQNFPEWVGATGECVLGQRTGMRGNTENYIVTYVTSQAN